jgi:lipoprotein-releasing system permease protein
MNLPFFIAKRYFFSKKKRNFINVISVISMLAVGFGSMALVVALSVFNGLEEMLKSLHAAFDPDLKVLPVKGKFFNKDSHLQNRLAQLEGIEVVSEVLEDNAYVKYQEAQMFVTVKGVDENYLAQGNLVNNIVEGRFQLMNQGIPYALVGRGVQYALGISLANDFNPLQLFYPKKGIANVPTNPNRSTVKASILPSGVFAIIKEYDEKYILVPLETANRLFQVNGKLSAFELKVKPGYDERAVKKNVVNLLGGAYKVLDKNEQHSSILRALKIEKLFVFLTFSFIISIAAFNIFFGLTMLGLEKKKDIAVLLTIGANESLVSRIFLLEGAIIAFSGAAFGLLLGFIIVWAQQTFGFVSMGMSTSIIDAYPVKMIWTDFLFAGIVIVVITFLASYKPSQIARRVDTNKVL